MDGCGTLTGAVAFAAFISASRFNRAAAKADILGSALGSDGMGAFAGISGDCMRGWGGTGFGGACTGAFTGELSDFGKALGAETPVTGTVGATVGDLG